MVTATATKSFLQLRRAVCRSSSVSRSIFVGRSPVPPPGHGVALSLAAGSVASIQGHSFARKCDNGLNNHVDWIIESRQIFDRNGKTGRG